MVTYQKLRGGKRRENQNRRLKTDKDERTIPISTALYELVKDMSLIKGSDDPSGHKGIRQLMTLGVMIIPINKNKIMELKLMT